MEATRQKAFVALGTAAAVTAAAVYFRRVSKAKKRSYINLSFANVATTSPVAAQVAAEWAEKLARGGSAEFGGDEEKHAMMPLRQAASVLLRCRVEDVCVGSSATELLASLAWAIGSSPKVEGVMKGIPRGSNIVSTKAAFPTTVYPFARVAEAYGAEVRLADYRTRGTHEVKYTDPDDIFALIDAQTAVVVLSHVEFSTGQRYDLRRFAAATHAVGALLIVDATQSMGVVPIDAPNTGADAIVSAGYKWLRGAFGVGVGFISPAMQRALVPGLVGFRSHYPDMWDLDATRYVLPPDASRFEYTTIAFGAALGMAAAVEELNRFGGAPAAAAEEGGWGIERVWAHDLRLCDRLVRGARKLNLAVASPISTDAERSGIISLVPPEGAPAEDLARTLQDKHGILVTNRCGLLRVSPHIDNIAEDIDKLLAALEECLGD